MRIPLIHNQLELAGLRASPAIWERSVGTWRIRCSNGYTRQANAVYTIPDPQIANIEYLAERIIICETIHKDWHLCPLFRLTEFNRPELDTILEQRGYKVHEPSCYFMLKSLDSIKFSDTEPLLRHLDTDSWLTRLFELRQRVQHHRDIQEAILSAIQLPTVFVVLEQHGLTYACGYGVLDGDYCGLFGLATAEIYRNRGYGTRIVQALLHWAQASKAKFAYLQVNQTNAAAVHTYKKAGFETAYTYWYRYHSEFSAGNWLFSKKDQE